MGPASTSRYTSTAYTDIGPVRQINEDRFLNLNERGVWAVADGMGGHSHGAKAAQTVVDALAHAAAANNGSDLGAALKNANAELLATMAPGQVAGATVATLQISDEGYECFWAGDCRVYRLRAGKILQLTVDHSEIQELVIAGLVTPHEAASHPRRHVVTRAVGVHKSLEIDCVRGAAFAGDIFVLCSDGLTLSCAEIGQELQSELQSPNAAERLVQSALAKGGTDNVAAVVVALIGA